MALRRGNRRYADWMASPIRRRVAAVVTCLVLGFATFGYMQRGTAEAVHEVARAAGCEAPADLPEHKAGRFLCLFDD
jgi:hypothetical protein